MACSAFLRFSIVSPSILATSYGLALVEHHLRRLQICPAGKPLNYVGINQRNRAHRYYSTVKRCRGCGQKPQCTRGKFRRIAIHTCEAARQKAEEVAKTPEFAVALRKRRKVEALFSELKNLIGLRRLRLRRIKFVREQFYLAAVAQNLKRLVRFLNMRAQPAMASA